MWSCAGGEGDDGLAVGDCQHAGLFADESVLDDKTVAGLAELALAGDPFDGCERLLAAGADDHAFAGGQAVGLHHDGALVAVLQVRDRLLGVAEGAEVGRGHVGVAEQVLAEDLAGLELRGELAGPEGGYPRVGEGVDGPGRERRLGANDRQADLVLAGELDKRGDVAVGDVDVLGIGRRAGVARGDEHTIGAGALGDLPCQGVLAPTGTDDEDVH